MAQLEVRLVSLEVGDAGEDGSDGNAEWRLDFSATAGDERHQFTSFDESFVAPGADPGAPPEANQVVDRFVVPFEECPGIDPEDCPIDQIDNSFIFRDFNPETDIVRLSSNGSEGGRGDRDILPGNSVFFRSSPVEPGETLLVRTFAEGDNPDSDTGRSPTKGGFSYQVTWKLSLSEDVPFEEEEEEDELTDGEEADLLLAEDSDTAGNSAVGSDDFFFA